MKTNYYLLGKYLVNISEVRVLTPTEEKALFEKFQKNGDVRIFQKIVKANLQYVVSIAMRYQCKNLSLFDLINYGNIGLIKAVHRFDVTRGLKFITYAAGYIRGAILNAINEYGRSVITGGGALTMLSLDEPISKDTTIFLREFVVDRSVVNSDEIITFHMMRADLQKILLKTLTGDEYKVIDLHFGLTTGKAIDLQDIAKRSGLSRFDVIAIKNRALNKLRLHKVSKELRVYAEIVDIPCNM